MVLFVCVCGWVCVRVCMHVIAVVCACVAMHVPFSSISLAVSPSFPESQYLFVIPQ